jgi:hypothetical protein
VLLVCAVVTSDAVTLFQHDYNFHELKGEIFGVVSLSPPCSWRRRDETGVLMKRRLGRPRQRPRRRGAK